MPGSVVDLPGLRPGVRAYVFSAEDDEAIQTRVEDLDEDWIAVAIPETAAAVAGLRIGRFVDVEIPQAGGDLILLGSVVEHGFDGVPLAVIRVEQAGADQAVMMGEQRRHFRLGISLPLRQFAYRASGDEPWAEASAMLHDLSAGGASLMVDEALEPGTAVRLRFPMPLDALEWTVSGTVLDSQQLGTARHPEWRLSVEFDALPEADRNWLSRQIYRYQWALKSR
jgi:c-di-GMP-binding flagellar brake protein YcgR